MADVCIVQIHVLNLNHKNYNLLGPGNGANTIVLDLTYCKTTILDTKKVSFYWTKCEGGDT